MKNIIRDVILYILSITLFFAVYVCIFKISIIALYILLAFFCVYCICMNVSWKSIRELKKYEQKLIKCGLDNKDYNKILCLSLATLLSTYFCIFLVSLVPLYTYEIWFIAVFPCILLNVLPASSVLEEYFELTRKKLPFLLFFILIIIICCSLGIFISHLFFSN